VDPHEEILKEALEAEDTPPPFWKKPFILLFGALLVVLMMSFIFVTYPIGDIIQGQLVSSPLENNRIITDKLVITFDEAIVERLDEWYFAEQRNEWTACLLGTKYEWEYHITEAYQPRMWLQSYNHVQFEACDKDTLLMLHTHPYKSCQASPTDLATLADARITNPDVLMVVMCEPARFSVY